METCISPASKFVFVALIFLFFSSSVSSSSLELSTLIINSTTEHYNYTAISEFRVLNRKPLKFCQPLNPYVHINVSRNSNLSDEEFVTVTVSGVSRPSKGDWVAMISPSHAEYELSRTV